MNFMKGKAAAILALLAIAGCFAYGASAETDATSSSVSQMRVAATTTVAFKSPTSTTTASWKIGSSQRIGWDAKNYSKVLRTQIELVDPTGADPLTYILYNAPAFGSYPVTSYSNQTFFIRSAIINFSSGPRFQVPPTGSAFSYVLHIKLLGKDPVTKDTTLVLAEATGTTPIVVLQQDVKAPKEKITITDPAAAGKTIQNTDILRVGWSSSFSTPTTGYSVSLLTFDKSATISLNLSDGNPASGIVNSMAAGVSLLGIRAGRYYVHVSAKGPSGNDVSADRLITITEEKTAVISGTKAPTISCAAQQSVISLSKNPHQRQDVAVDFSAHVVPDTADGVDRSTFNKGYSFEWRSGTTTVTTLSGLTTFSWKTPGRHDVAVKVTNLNTGKTASAHCSAVFRLGTTAAVFDAVTSFWNSLWNN